MRADVRLRTATTIRRAHDPNDLHAGIDDDGWVRVPDVGLFEMALLKDTKDAAKAGAEIKVVDWGDMNRPENRNEKALMEVLLRGV